MKNIILNAILLALIPLFCYEVGIIFCWLFDIDSFINIHKVSWSRSIVDILWWISGAILIYNLVYGMDPDQREHDDEWDDIHPN